MITTGPATDGLAKELAALEAVARALVQLSDGDSRARVLRWAVERFDVAHAAGDGQADRRPDDPTLAVDDLREMFELAAPGADDDTLVVSAPPEPPAPRRPDVPLDSLLKTLATDLRRAGHEWQRA